MSSSLYSIGLSGLQSSTARISTTGQNTANVDTEGYSRQTTGTVSVSGGGVRIQDTERVVNHYINQQLWSDTSTYNYYESYRSMMSSFDSVLGEESVSISTYVDSAFSALQTANSDPTDSAARSNAYANLSELVAQYNELADYITTQESLATDDLANNLSSVNNIASQIAELNSQIYKLESSSGSTANELRDTQEQLVKELSGYLDVKVKYDDNNLMTVNLASGQPLVLQGNNNELKLSSDSSNPDNEVSISLSFGKYDVGISSEDLGGSVGAMIAFRNEFVATAERMLGQQALSLADSMNTQNQLGLDANGGYGINLFSTGKINVTPNTENSDASLTISAELTSGSSADISTDTYEVVMTSATAFKVVTYDVSGNISEQSDPIDITGNTGAPYEVEGFGVSITLDPAETYASGDKFQFIPTKNAASTLKLSARSGDDLALAAPIAVSSGSSNLSDVTISISSINNTDSSSSAFTQTGGLYASSPQSLNFTASDEMEVLDGNGNVIATVSGITNYSNLLDQAGLASDAGFDISLDGAPIAGDTFTMEFNDAGEADNYNGLLLASLQNESTVGGTHTYSEAFTSLVTEVGSLTASLSTNANSSEVIMNRSEAARDEISAVSLDEEAVNLLRYQQSYTASAQILSAAQSTFATLIGALG